MAETARARQWVFTLNNYTEKEVEHLKDADAKYIAWGYENAPETGTPHLQGFVYFYKQLRFKKAREAIGLRARIAVMKSTLEQNIEYCSKEGNFYEQGERPKIAKKLEEILKMSLNEADAVMREERAWASGSSNWQRLRMSLIKPFEGDFKVYWLVGPTGSGKSRAARETYGATTAIRLSKGGQWIYKGGHDVVVYEEADKMKIELAEFLLLTNRYAYELDTKGSSCPRDFHTIIFTSTVYPSCVYSEHYEQVERRITEIVEFN